MSDPRLPKEHELQVLNKLSTDDAFRTHFESDPSGALKAAGVPDSAIASLGAAKLKPGKLADKSVIATTYDTVNGDNLGLHACMVFPLLRLNYGASAGDKAD